MVRSRSPTPDVRASLTSSNVDVLSPRRRTAFASFSAITKLGRRVAAGRARFSLSMECTKELNRATLGSAMPRTSSA
eukprot:6191039-Pleurochrysis_carterae.AAC.1